MTAVGIIWFIVLTLVSAVAVRGLLRMTGPREGAPQRDSTALVWFLLALALLLTNLPSGIDPFRAVGLHLGAAALLGFVLHVLTRGSAGKGRATGIPVVAMGSDRNRRAAGGDHPQG